MAFGGRKTSSGRELSDDSRRLGVGWGSLRDPDSGSGVNSGGDVTVTPSLRTLNEAMLYKAM